MFVKELDRYRTEQDYFEDYNRVKDEAINSIKCSEAYEKFQEEDMNKFAIIHKDLPGKDIYHPSNNGKTFISIDMKHANFSALQHYGDCMGKSMFAGASTWEDFISLFTNNKHIIDSKYIRQVILGNCDPKRHITYEKYLMNLVLDSLLRDNIIDDISNVIFFSNDEIVIDVSDLVAVDRKILVRHIEESLKDVFIPLKVELFALLELHGTHGGYYKLIYEDGYKIKFKCLDSLYIPFVIRYLEGEKATESDKTFYHNGLLARFIEIPDISN
jgi:hypothetical protein